MGLTRFLYGSIQLRMVYNGWKRVVLSFNQYHHISSINGEFHDGITGKTGFASLLAISGVIQHGLARKSLNFSRTGAPKDWRGWDSTIPKCFVCKSKGCLTESSIYMYICVYIYIYVHTHIHIYILCTLTHTHIYITYICFYIFRHTCVYIDICTAHM